MTYRIDIAPRAKKQLAKLHPDIKRRIDAAILTLANDPRPASPKGRKLEGSPSDLDEWRLRVGEYRVVYDIYDDVLVVTVVKVAKRGQATLYRGR